MREIKENLKCHACGKPRKQRTNQQNRALHLYFTHLAEALNEAGMDMRKTIRQDIDIPWTPHNIKEYLWRPVMQALHGNKSTTQMTTTDIDKIFDVINRTISERTGVFVAFPSIDTLIARYETNEKENTFS